MSGAVTSAGSPTGTCVGSVMAPPSKLLFPTMEGRTRHVQPDSRCGRQRRLPTPASADDGPNAGRQPHGPGIGSVPEPTRGDGHLAKRKSPSHFSSLKRLERPWLTASHIGFLRKPTRHAFPNIGKGPRQRCPGPLCGRFPEKPYAASAAIPPQLMDRSPLDHELLLPDEFCALPILRRGVPKHVVQNNIVLGHFHQIAKNL